jgi:hypothetical protein
MQVLNPLAEVCFEGRDVVAMQRVHVRDNPPRDVHVVLDHRLDPRLSLRKKMFEVFPPVAFIACIYALVASSVIATGLVDEGFSLSLSVEAVAVVLAACSLATAGWQASLSYRRGRRTAPIRNPATRS